MRRLKLFAKGNVDIHDSLHSCLISGELRWNGVNSVLRDRHPGVVIRLKHETLTRSDALLQAEDEIPPAILERDLPLGSFPARSQFSSALFHADAEAIILSIQPDTATGIFRNRRSGFLFYPNDLAHWTSDDRAWLRSDFEDLGLISAEQSLVNFRAIVDKARSHSDAPILIFNVSSIVPGETVHCLQGLGEIYSTRARRFNLGLAELSESTGISIVDVDAVLARGGADRLKLDAAHMSPAGYRLVAEEVVRILQDLGLFDPSEGDECEPA